VELTPLVAKVSIEADKVAGPSVIFFPGSARKQSGLIDPQIPRIAGKALQGVYGMHEFLFCFTVTKTITNRGLS
jgi:hypothetical protein